MKINFSYNKKFVDKPQSDLPESVHRAMWRHYNANFINTRDTPERLIHYIQQGFAYAPCHVRFRHQKNFIQGQALSLDFDENGAFDEILKHEFITKYAYFLYTTPSSTKANPRSRAVFVLPEPVKSATVFSHMARALVKEFDQADGACKDPSRIFYGSKNCDVLALRNTLPLNTIAKMATQIQKQDEIEFKKSKASATSTNCITSKTLNERLQPHLDAIATAPEGMKHSVRLKSATLVGGFVGAGYLGYSDALQQLLNSAMSNTTKPHLARKDIEDGLGYGMSSPVTIDPERFEDFGINIW